MFGLSTEKTRKQFVLVHGAFHGGWCWRDVAAGLARRGHHVTTPTLTGLGERAHLLSKHTGIETFTKDICNHIRYEELTEVVLVGHSFGGAIITTVAEQIPDRIDRLVYLDALIPESDRSLFDLLPQAVTAERRRTARESSEGLTIPCPPASVFGLSESEQIQRVDALLTPHPIKTYEDKIRLQYPPGGLKKSSYIHCAHPAYTGIAEHYQRAQSLDWSCHTLDTGHDCMISDPARTSGLLHKLATTD